MIVKLNILNSLNVQKSNFQAEKERMKLLKNALPKKVWEAKMRKKKKLHHAMKRAAKKSEQIIENDTYTGYSKAKQISEIYRRALKFQKPKKKEVIVGKTLLN